MLAEFFNLRADPIETVNLVNRPSHRELVNALRARTDALRQQYEAAATGMARAVDGQTR